MFSFLMLFKSKLITENICLTYFISKILYRIRVRKFPKLYHRHCRCLIIEDKTSKNSTKTIFLVQVDPARKTKNTFLTLFGKRILVAWGLVYTFKFKLHSMQFKMGHSHVLFRYIRPLNMLRWINVIVKIGDGPELNPGHLVP